MSSSVHTDATGLAGSLPHRFFLLLVSIGVSLSIAGCGGGGSGAGGGTASPGAVSSGAASLTVQVVDVTDMPISGALVDVNVKEVQRQAITGPDGRAEFADLPTGEFSIEVSAEGFDLLTATDRLGPGSQHLSWTLRSDREWSVGRAIVLGTRVVERESDDSSVTFSVDMAVVGETSDAIETLTASNFNIVPGSCAWGVLISCAYDSGVYPGYGAGDPFESPFGPDGGPLAFEWVPSANRHPYLVGVLVQRGNTFALDEKLTGLKSFFAALGGSDIAGLASVQAEDDSVTLEELGPFTSHGSTYLEAIDGLASPIGFAAAMADSLIEYIRRIAAIEADAAPGIERSVLVLANESDFEDLAEPTALARSLGIRVNHVGYTDLLGFRELAARTGGFVGDSSGDPRAYWILLGAMDQVLAGSMPFYRIHFRIKGEAGTFAPGRIATLWVKVDVPTPFPSKGLWVPVDILIP